MDLYAEYFESAFSETFYSFSLLTGFFVLIFFYFSSNGFADDVFLLPEVFSDKKKIHAAYSRMFIMIKL